MRQMRAMGIGVLVLACAVPLLAGRLLCADEPAQGGQASKPPWQRMLQGKEARQAEVQEQDLDELTEAGKLEEALKVAERLAELRTKAQGGEHWQAVSARWDVEAIRRVLRQRAEGRQDYARSLALQRQADSLEAKGRYKEAQPYRAEIHVIRRKALGEEHPHTAASYNNVAANLHDQGKYDEAEEGYRKALAIWRKVLGEEHPNTATSYNNVAFNLQAQGKYAEAEEGYRKGLAIRRRVLGEEHPDTAESYNNVAFNLQAQGKYAEAEEGLRKALAICRKVLGEDHHDTATSYSNVASNLESQGRYAEAEEGVRKALAICLKVLGEDHPLTATCYHNVAFNLNAQGRYQDAEATWLIAAKRFMKTRLRIASTGLDRATKTGENSALPSLAAVLARNGKAEAAWQRFEEALARGIWDDLSARLRRPPAEQARQTQFIARLNGLDQLIEKTLSIKEPTPAQTQRRKELLTERLKVQEDFDAFARHLEKTYGPAAGEVFDRARIQAALPPDTALVGWLDRPGERKAADPDGEHWAVLLRARGAPVWVRLRGSGPKNAWSDADTQLPHHLYAALHKPGGDWWPLAKRLRQQRLEPLAPHLAAGDGLPAVRHLIVLPAHLAGLPVEVFAEGYTVSYALSGTLHAHLREQRKVTSQGLLALADPVFDPPARAPAPLLLPPRGVLLTVVSPGSNAALSGLEPNDVLLRYHDTDLAGPADLKTLPVAADPAQRVRVTLWRNGKTLQTQVRPGSLGAVFAGVPAPQALAEQRKLDQRLASRGEEKWAPLPGTRTEVEALRRLFAAPAPKLLIDSAASEQQLYDLARSRELGQYRYVHLATHGIADRDFRLRSAVILSRDALPDPGKQLNAGLPVFDGRLTADKILRQWHLNSELVTLSACETALGKYEQGEGLVGFAQVLILAGSRSVVLSQWKVDDAATALLMERFYQNLLGKRAGLKGPMRKALALAEAKTWLRTLSRDEAVKRVAHLTKGVARSKDRPRLPPLPPVPASPVGTREAPPYAHPYYWAAFVLIGDPD